MDCNYSALILAHLPMMMGLSLKNNLEVIQRLQRSHQGNRMSRTMVVKRKIFSKSFTKEDPKGKEGVLFVLRVSASSSSAKK